MGSSGSVYRSLALLCLTLPAVACGQPGTDNPFASDGGPGLTPSASDGTTTTTSAGSSTAGGTGGTGGTGETSEGSGQGTDSEVSDADESGETTSGDPGSSTTGDPDALPFTLDEVVWLYPDISAWPETITMSSITLEGELLCLNHDIATQEPAWPIVLTFGTTEVVGNAWVFIEEGGQWYAATWEWLRPPGQTCKFASAVEGGHIKVDPFGEFSGWVPTSGQSYYFMVSGLIRNPNYSNVMERSNIVEYVWP